MTPGVWPLVTHHIHGAAELPAGRYGNVVVRDETDHRHAVRAGVPDEIGDQFEVNPRTEGSTRRSRAPLR